MLEVIKNVYLNIPEWGRMTIILWLTLMLFKAYLKNLYVKKDFVSASFYIILFIVSMYSILNYIGSDFNLIDGGY